MLMNLERVHFVIGSSDQFDKDSIRVTFYNSDAKIIDIIEMNRMIPVVRRMINQILNGKDGKRYDTKRDNHFLHELNRVPD